MGLNSYRFSIEWSRLQPTPETWDEAAFVRYDQILQACKDNGLKPMVTLHHFTNPQWFADHGGWLSPDAVELFMQYAKKAVERWSTQVDFWCTFNEPMVLAVGGYAGGFMPPDLRQPHLVGEASHNLFLAHTLTYDLIHADAKIKNLPEPLVGIAHNMLEFEPLRHWHPLDLILSRTLDAFYNRAWLDAITGGKLRFAFPGMVPRASEKEQRVGRSTCDYIGINYYTKAVVAFRFRPRSWRPSPSPISRIENKVSPAELPPFDLTFARPNDVCSDVDWAIYPQGFEKIIRRVARFGKPIFITENGIADKKDALRPQYLKQHLAVVQKLRAEKVDVRGYYHWSLLDNFEWIKGFKPRFGLLRMNYKTLEREWTKSAWLYRDFIREDLKNNGPSQLPSDFSDSSPRP